MPQQRLSRTVSVSIYRATPAEVQWLRCKSVIKTSDGAAGALVTRYSTGDLRFSDPGSRNRDSVRAGLLVELAHAGLGHGVDEDNIIGPVLGWMSRHEN